MARQVLWLTGMPRSGTNWASQLLASCPALRMKFCPLFSYEFKNARGGDSSPEEWRSFFGDVYDTNSEYLDQDYLRKDGLVPQFAVRDAEPAVLGIKSTRYHHLTEGLLEKVPEVRFIGIVRNPAACIHSWLTNRLEFPSGADPRVEWRTGACRKSAVEEFWGFDDWVTVTHRFLRWSELYPDRFRLLRYEALVAQAERQTRSLFDWAGLPYTEQTARFVAESQARSHGHRRAVYQTADAATRWRGEIDPEMYAVIRRELSGSPLERFLDDGVEP